MKPARTETYDHAISALLSRRSEVLEELASLRDQQARVANGLDALDRTLELLGYAGEVQLTESLPRTVLFYRGELRQYLLAQIREHGTRTAREMAQSLARQEGKQVADRRMLIDMVKRISKALRQMADAGMVARTADRISGAYVWRLAD